MTTDTDWLGDQATEPVNRGGRPAKDYAARGNRKVECPGCGFHFRTSAAQLAKLPAAPACPACGDELHVPELRDRAALDLDGTLDELARAGFEKARSEGKSTGEAEEAERVARNNAARALGRRALVIPAPDRTHAPQAQRCRWTRSYCNVLTNARLCPTHAAMAANGDELR